MKLWLIKFPYWLGIVADALWAVALLFPAVFGVLTGVDDFSPDWQMQSVMAIGGGLMAAALFLLALANILKGNTNEYWILIKCLVLFVAMLTSYSLAGGMDRTAVDL